jgi:MFS family permease
MGLSKRLILRFGPRRTLIPGVFMVIFALLLLARAPVNGHYVTDLLPPFLLLGIGAGTSFPASMTLSMSGANPSEAGLASGLVNTSLQVGGVVGLAALATLSAERTETMLESGYSAATALTAGYHLAFLVGAGLAAIGAMIAIFVLRSARPKEQGFGEPRPEYNEVS